MSERIDCRGKLTFRTKILTQQHAESFCKALQAHSAFIEVEVQESPRAKGEKRFFVSYLPAKLERQEAMRDRQQSAREDRARTQQFTFVKDSDHPFFHCLSHATGNCYCVTERSCDCLDSEVRCTPNRIPCKHQLALRFAIRAGTEFEDF
jgi:hypothetical protein